jgi:hypothetical protein
MRIYLVFNRLVPPFVIGLESEISLDPKDSVDGVWHTYWGSGICPSFRIKETEEYVSETGSVSVLSWREEDAYSDGPLRKD